LIGKADVWTAFAGSESPALAVLRRRPDLLSRHRRGDLLDEHTRDVAGIPACANAINTAAQGWGRVLGRSPDMDVLAADVIEQLADLPESGQGRILHVACSAVVGAYLGR
jgi:hypothetical protein